VRVKVVNVVLMRHGRAGTARSDEERRLSSEGEEGVRRVAEKLGALGLSSPGVISSPLVRAVETAEIVAEAIGAVSVSTSVRLKPGLGVEGPIELLRGLPPAGDLVLIGHQPDMGILAAFICAVPVIRLSPGEAVCISILDPGTFLSGELVCVISPEQAV